MPHPVDCKQSLQALDDFHSLRKVSLVGNLHHVSPHALVVFGKHGRHVLDRARARSHGCVERVARVAGRHVRVPETVNIGLERQTSVI
jgi:hypothetical protein